jgi:hypothetical protein
MTEGYAAHDWTEVSTVLQGCNGNDGDTTLGSCGNINRAQRCFDWSLVTIPRVVSK